MASTVTVSPAFDQQRLQVPHESSTLLAAEEPVQIVVRLEGKRVHIGVLLQHRWSGVLADKALHTESVVFRNGEDSEMVIIFS